VTTADDGLVTITGGKLTTYRTMAEDTVGAVGKVLGRKLGPGRTRRLRLRGADGAPALAKPGAAGSFGVDDAMLAELAGRYGGEALAVLGLIEQEPELAEPLVPGLPYVAAEAVYGVRYEMAQCLEDVLARRTRALLLDASASREAAAAVAQLVATELGWADGRVASEVASLGKLVERELAAVRTAGEQFGGPRTEGGGDAAPAAADAPQSGSSGAGPDEVLEVGS
jgi:glycerol-3-phosphate dehydrogenase